MALAPVAPEAGLSLGLILVALACLFLLALNKAWRFSVGAMLDALSGAISNLPHVTVVGVKVPPWKRYTRDTTRTSGR